MGSGGTGGPAGAGGNPGGLNNYGNPGGGAGGGIDTGYSGLGKRDTSVSGYRGSGTYVGPHGEVRDVATGQIIPGAKPPPARDPNAPPVRYSSTTTRR